MAGENYEINKYYDFEVVADSVLGSSYRNAKLVSIMDYRVAKKFGSVDYIHRQVRPYIESTVSKDINTYTFLLFRYKDKDLVIAREWMRSITLIDTESSVLRLEIEGASIEMRKILEKHLNILGLTFTITEGD